MAHYTEDSVITKITKQLKKKNRMFYNIHGGQYGGKNGKPDFLVITGNGIMTGIEAKKYNENPFPTQIRRGKEIIDEGGRYIIAHKDFVLEDVDAGNIPKIPYDGEDMVFPKNITCEMIDGGREDGE